MDMTNVGPSLKFLAAQACIVVRCLPSKGFVILCVCVCVCFVVLLIAVTYHLGQVCYSSLSVASSHWSLIIFIDIVLCTFVVTVFRNLIVGNRGNAEAVFRIPV